MREHITLGQWTEQSLDRLLHEASGMENPGEQIGYISRHFINTPYQESTLIGSMGSPEELVINLEGMDCFTFIDMVEAMRRSGSFHDLKNNLLDVRYRSSIMSYEGRNHFFTDWKALNARAVIDVTKYIGAEKTRDVSKRLNEDHHGNPLLPGVPCRLREVTYIQSMYVDDSVTDNLSTGDYIGVYSKQDGLDVSHVGIFVRQGSETLLRHASSVKGKRKVLDEDFSAYLKAGPGIIVLRPRD